MPEWTMDAKLLSLLLWSVGQAAILWNRSQEHAKILKELLEWRQSTVAEWREWRGGIDQSLSSIEETLERHEMLLEKLR